MIVIDKRYTIKFSYAGYSQYATFNESKGELIRPRLLVSYAKIDEIPSVENLKSIDEILEVIKKIAYGNKAEIHLINGMPVEVYNNTEASNFIDGFVDRYESFIEAEAIKYWENHLLPIMKENKWFIGPSRFGAPVLICKDENDEWDNIPRDNKQIVFEYLCYRFAKKLNRGEANLKTEHSNHVDGFQPFIYMINIDYLKETGIYIEL